MQTFLRALVLVVTLMATMAAGVTPVNGQSDVGSPANPVKAWRGEAARTG
jgi:hypothetical protein